MTKINSDNIESKIRDLIHSSIYLRDVPYSLEEGAQEVDPDSLSDAAAAVTVLNEKMYKTLESILEYGSTGEDARDIKELVRNLIKDLNG
jgi:SOS-response transcriptional repressor LexA